MHHIVPEEENYLVCESFQDETLKWLVSIKLAGMCYLHLPWTDPVIAALKFLSLPVSFPNPTLCASLSGIQKHRNNALRPPLMLQETW